NLDWKGTPSKKCEPTKTIIEHWSDHVNGWLTLAQSDKNLLIIRYEDLVEQPYAVYCAIRKQFFRYAQKKTPNNLKQIEKPLGLLPNQGKTDSWKIALGVEDHTNIYGQIPE